MPSSLKLKNVTVITSGPCTDEGLSQEWLDLEKKLCGRPMSNRSLPPEEQRKVQRKFCANRDESFQLPGKSEDINITDKEICSDLVEVPIPIRIYSPPQLSGSDGETAPVAVYYHGGGWVLGSIAEEDVFCRMLVHDLQHVVVSVEYRLAPEHQFPAAVDDCFAALLWVIENIGCLKGDVNQVYVTGNSAGGQLSSAVALRMIECNSPFRLAAQALRIPLTCHPRVYPGSMPVRETVPIMTDSSTLLRLDTYVPDQKDWTSFLLSPLLAPAGLIRDLPPTYIDVCSCDPFETSGTAYAEKLESNGIPVKYTVLQGMPHGSFMLFPGLQSSIDAQRALVDGIVWALEQSKGRTSAIH